MERIEKQRANVWRLGAVIAAGALGLAGCSKSPEEQKAVAAAHEAQTTGRLVVKSNRPNTTVEAMRITTPTDATTASAKGNPEGAAEHALPALPPGKYTVTAHADGWPDVRAEASVEAGRATEVAINFKSGSLRLDTDPTGAMVRLGEAVLGKTPLVIPQLPPGECRLSLEYPAWPALAFKATITENVEAAATVRLPYGKLTVESAPPGAMVIMGGKTVGQTPLTLDRVPAGIRKVTLQAKDFPPMEITVTVEDKGEAKANPALGSAFPELGPEALLRAVWVPDDPNRLSPPNEGTTGPAQPLNGIIKNLNRKFLYDRWLHKRYCFTGTIKTYDPASGLIEFTEGQSELSRYRVRAKLPPEKVRNNKDLLAQLGKGATFALYGYLSAVEEPRWPFKVITFELTLAEPLR